MELDNETYITIPTPNRIEAIDRIFELNEELNKICYNNHLKLEIDTLDIQNIQDRTPYTKTIIKIYKGY